MTLKTRLTAMMIMILVAVVGLQFLLMEQERRELVSRLSRLSETVNRSTAEFVQRSHTLAAEHPPGGLASLLEQMKADSAASPRAESFSVQMFMWADSSGEATGAIRRVSSAHPPELRGMVSIEDETCVDTIAVPGEAGRRVIQKLEATNVRTRSVLAWRDSTRLPFERLAARSRTPEGEDIIIHLPLFAGGPESLYSVEVRYGFGHVAEELAASRRRGLLWMTAILGVGALGAVLVARQFTKPIQTLQTSFGEVTRGNLDLRVQPERRDEIGHLTDSFNQMVAKLRESRAMEHRLAEAEHFASLGQLAAGVAHEVRNPLNAIQLTLQHMRDRVRANPRAAADDPEFETYFRMATSEIARLDRMVSAFLDLSKSGELTRTRADLAESLGSAVALFRPLAAERGVDLRSEIEPALSGSVDTARLPMVWNNLISNAIEATPRGGTVDVTARRSGESGRAAVIEVRDTGVGIAPELLGRIWEPFVSGKENGTGLGLSIVRSVVERHGGSVGAESAPGTGTSVRVIFPLEES